MNLIINGAENETAYGLRIDGIPEIPTPEQRIEQTEVGFRDGELVRKKGFKNIPIPVDFNILASDETKSKLRLARAWLMSAETIRFSDDDVYYKVKNVQIEPADFEAVHYAVLPVVFECESFQYALPTELTLTTSGTSLQNPGTYVSRPLIKIYGSGSIKLTVGATEVALKDIVDHIILDCDLMEAYKDETSPLSRNYLMSGKFPELAVGSTKISWTGTVREIVIDPRWRYI